MIKTVHVCDFCGADEHKVEKVVKGRYVPGIGPVCICDECVDLCVGIIKGEGTGEDLDALRLDAERYRALRNLAAGDLKNVWVELPLPPDMMITGTNAKYLDAATDLLLAKQQETLK